MRSTLKLLIFLFIFSGTALCQERIVKMMAGPGDDGFRVMVSFMSPVENGYNLQSLIIDVNQVKNKKETPTSYYVDMTTTVRNLETGAKKQSILVLRWDKSGEIEVKCEGGKWAKQTSGPELDNIVETVKAVVQNSPLETKKVTDFTLPKTIEEKATTILNSLEKSKLLCIRSGS